MTLPSRRTGTPKSGSRLLASLDLLEDLASVQHVGEIRSLRLTLTEVASLAIPTPLQDTASRPDGLGLG